MSLTKDKLKEEILDLIRKVGKERNGYLKFNYDCLLRKWEQLHPGEAFSNFHFGGFKKFLIKVCNAKDFGERTFGIPKSCPSPQSNKKSAVIVQKLETATSGDNEIPGPTAGAKPKFIILKFELLSVIQDILEEDQYLGKEEAALKLNTLLQAWQKVHQKENFPAQEFGKFRQFLIHHCNLKPPHPNNNERDVVVANKESVENQIKELRANYADIIREARLTGGLLKDTDCTEPITSYAPDPTAVMEHPQESQNMNDAACAGNSETTEDRTVEPTQTGEENNDNLEVKVVKPPVPPAVESSQSFTNNGSTIIVKEQAKEPDVALKQLIETKSKGPTNDQRNFLQLVIILYRCSLETLRQVFRRIHPSWKNSTDDLLHFNKGILRFDFPKEKTIFETGDIDQWDLTLLTKVLRFTKVSQDVLKKDPLYSGYLDAMKSLKDMKNDFVSHVSKPEFTDVKFKRYLSEMETSLITLGLDKNSFDTAVNDADLTPENLYYQMFREEVSRMEENLTREIREGNKETGGKLDGLQDGMDRIETLMHKIARNEIEQRRIPEQAVQADKESWDTWVKTKRMLNNFDCDNNQYILVVDKVASADRHYLDALANISWKLVLDFDPDSDLDGFLRNSPFDDAESGLLVTHTPSQLASQDRCNNINMKRVQWMFVNGQNKGDEEDEPKSSIVDWRRKFKPRVNKIIEACCSKLDKMKPTFCLVLSLRNDSVPIANVVVQEIDSIFSCATYKMGYVSLSSELDLEELPGSEFSALSLKSLFIGIHSLLGGSTDKYFLPTRLAELPVAIPKKQYHYFAEYLDVLYQDCEGIPTELSKEEFEAFENDHLKSFIGGNPISFESLHFGHDVTRSVTRSISQYISKMPDRFNTPQIVQICHSPGTGGTTIARRLLWDLRSEHPCAIVKMASVSENPGIEAEDEQFVASLVNRIGNLEETCDLWPIVLIDGNPRVVRLVSDHLVRKLNAGGKKAIIVRCVYPQGLTKLRDAYLHEKSNFTVGSILEDNDHDLLQFKTKFKDYCDRFQGTKDDRERIKSSTRVFHFPMMAMLEEFTKLDEIVYGSLDILKEDHSTEYEVAVLVSFLQIYSNWETPAILIAKYLKKKDSTYDEISGEFSDNLLNLMISKKAPSKQKWIASRNFAQEEEDGDDDDEDLEGESSSTKGSIKWYTFQHRKIAEKVIAHSKRSLDEITQDFIDSPVLVYYQDNINIKQLVNDLLLHNKESSESHFSQLIDKLENGSRIFESAAKKAKDASLFSHAARFIAYSSEKPDFKKAIDLIEEGLRVDKKASREKIRGVRDTEGHILLREMKAVKKKKIKTIEDLERYAEKALHRFRKARDNPPMTFPNPLNGEVNVWQFCFDWIIRWKESDVEEAIKFMMSDDFFRSAISDCFYLLDAIERMVQSVPRLPDPLHTMRLANDSRISLLSTLGRTVGKTKRRAIQSLNVADLCDKICTRENFKVANEKELTRLQVSWMISQAGKRDIHLLQETDRPKLQELLEKLVMKYKMYEYAVHAIGFSTVQGHSSYNLEKAFNIAKNWQKALPYDAFSHFFTYVICFLQIINGSVMEYRPKYEDAVETCVKKCEGNHRRFLQQYFIRKGEDSERMSRLISHAELEQQYGTEPNRRGQKTDDALGSDFWSKDSKKYLQECRGRLRFAKRHPHSKKEYPFIALEQGQLKISVPKHFYGEDDNWRGRQDQRVRFIVCFTLAGPKAKAIEFEDATKASGGTHFGRQLSSNSKSKK